MTNPYDNFSYISIERWASFWHQIKTVSDARPQSILEVGVGNHVVYDYFKSRGFSITSVDNDKRTRPDVMGTVGRLPFKDNSFDVVLCAEVLEHLPYEVFEECLGELARVAKRNVVLTLPHWGRHFSVDIRLPLIKRLRFYTKFSLFPKRHHSGGPHEWEIGKRGYPLRRVKRSIEKAGFSIARDEVLFEMPYHHLFVLNV